MDVTDVFAIFCIISVFFLNLFFHDFVILFGLSLPIMQTSDEVDFPKSDSDKYLEETAIHHSPQTSMDSGM